MHIPVPATGEIVTLTELSDPIYQQHLLGDGLGIIMTRGEIIAPVSGTVENVDYAKCQVKLVSRNGLRLLIQIGIPGEIEHAERVDFNVKAKQSCRKGQRLALCDTLWIKQQGKIPLCILTLVNTSKLKAIETTSKKQVRMGEDTLLTLFI